MLKVFGNKNKKNANDIVDLEEVKEVEPRFTRIVDKIVQIYIYSAVLGLVGYMILSLGNALYVFVYSLIFGYSFGGGHSAILHVVAFTIVLVKAYIVLLEYAKTKHININYILEIAIIAPVLEIIFNFDTYDLYSKIFLGVFTVSITFIYLYFYDTLRKVNHDYLKEHEKNFKSSK